MLFTGLDMWELSAIVVRSLAHTVFDVFNALGIKQIENGGAFIKGTCLSTFGCVVTRH